MSIQTRTVVFAIRHNEARVLDAVHRQMSGSAFADLGLAVVGLGTQYPAYLLPPGQLEALSRRFYPDSPAMSKVLSINRSAGIETRASIAPFDHAMHSGEETMSIADLHDVFMREGVPLAVSAAEKALAESGLDLASITHVVSATCTDSANPGFDHFVTKGLGITHPVEKVLLHGVGCSGGLAALRTAANLALGHAARRLPARVLCVTLEVNTPMARSELDRVHRSQETRIAACLFSDAATAVVLSNDVGLQVTPVYELLGWQHRIIPDTEQELGFDVEPSGWKAILTSRVPDVSAAAIVPTFNALLAALPPLPRGYAAAADFDWALHPGGPAILREAARVLGGGVTREQHLRASWDVYGSRGNSGSATIYSVLDRLRRVERERENGHGDGVERRDCAREYVVACAFGPGVAVEMCMLRRVVP
ncbi:type iii polyketide synthase [Purpureocillium lavendulum]|uniref:Type iii polyketide synthase n=1 Tax=Purpureocillium lavendulum TaxID=1247861 RepID=A0AB34FFE9_9HYPO|nr:type iii polyketide synthase [Purpureocillium lavendulum]